MPPKDFTRTFDIIYYQLKHYPQEVCIALCNPEKPEKKYSTQETVDAINKVSVGLMRLGIKKGDKIAIVSPNRPEWSILDHAILQLGAIDVPLYPTISPEEYEFILNDSESVAIFVGSTDIWQRVKPALEKTPNIKHVFSFDGLEGTKHWEELFVEPTEEELQKLEEYKQAVQPDDLATILYTSGTTGVPKGVMLTHGNFTSNVQGTFDLLPMKPGDRALSFLPINHVFERHMVYLYQAKGLQIYFVDDLNNIVPCAQKVKPHVFATVPRLLEKVYERILQKGLELTGFKRAIFFGALNFAKNYNPEDPPTGFKKLLHKLYDKLVFSKWREALGGEITALVSGGAALRPDLARIFWAAGIPVLEGYGLTETSPVIAVNRLEPGGFKIGTVGPPLFNVEVKIAEDGEILTRGPHVMKGYYKRPDLTKEVIDEEGWFHTGDIGVIVDGKFLKITDRKKELFKTAGGKYVAPQPIENSLKASLLIENAMVVGEGRKFPAALIVPSEENLKSWMEANGIKWEGLEKALQNPKVIDKYREIIKEVNKHLAKPEQIKRFAFVTDTWSVETGELTPTMKLKRRVLNEKYKDIIDGIYEGTVGYDVYKE
ncbi:MAG: long-chain fatty acid--CoA ligase [Chlorobi bacterium]|nr:long-chain fatty acid--CoA ligase [Chlorobiota bacterium]